jgi:putative transposase
MPKRRYERREPTHEWSQIRPYLKDALQINYELIRPVILFGVSAKERAAETGQARSPISHQANLFAVSGRASPLAPEPPPTIPKLDKRILSSPMRQAIVDLHAEYPEHHVDKSARILSIQCGRRPSAQSMKLTLADGPQPSRTMRRFPLFSEMADPRERRLAITRLHAEDWTPTSIAGYLGTSRQTVYTTLNPPTSFAHLHKGTTDVKEIFCTRPIPPSGRARQTDAYSVLDGGQRRIRTPALEW